MAKAGYILCPYDVVISGMPEIRLILDQLFFERGTQYPVEEYLIDVKVQELWKGFMPNTTIWHTDFLPDDKDHFGNDGNRNKIKGDSLYMYVSDRPAPEFRKEDGTTFTMPIREWFEYNQNDWHRARPLDTQHSIRIWIRVVPKVIIESNIPSRKERLFSQVYLPEPLAK